MKKENIEVVAIKGDFEGEMVNVTLQVSKNGDKSETITRQSVITDETNFEELVEQCLKEHCGHNINIIQKSIMVETTKIQLDSAIRTKQELEGISIEDIDDCINDCEADIENAENEIESVIIEEGIDATVKDVEVCGLDALGLDDSDQEESEKEWIADTVEENLETIDRRTEDKQELEEKREKIKNFNKKVTFGSLYSEKFASRSSEIVDTIMTKVPFAALVMYFLCYRKSDDFLQHEHSFKQYMIPIDAELGGFDGENFHMENTDECYQVLKDMAYELYKAIPGKEK